MEKPKDVVVIGASISGLMHGVMLKRLGHNVRIIEQNPTAFRADYAAGIGTGPAGKAFLQEEDRTGKPYSIPFPAIRFLDEQSKVAKEYDFPLNATSWDAVYYRLRANFDGLESPYYETAPDPVSTDGKGYVLHGKKALGVSEIDKDTLLVDIEDVNNHSTEQIRADLVIDAAGAYSAVRNKLVPGIKNPYAGYIAWRGTVPESQTSEFTVNAFSKRLIFNLRDHKSYFLGYTVPGVNGALADGQRFLNWIWYYPLNENSPFFKRVFTDVDGNVHRNSLPKGKLDPSVWKDVLNEASALKATPAFLELMQKTERPFVSTIRDCESPRAALFNGKYFIVGDALNLLRPHTGMSINQSATHCKMLRKVMEGEITWKQWETALLDWGHGTALLSKTAGEWHLRNGLGWTRFILRYIRFTLFSWWSKVTRLWRVSVPVLGNVSSIMTNQD